MELKEQIIDDIKNNPVILYMKGTKDMPMCGFSNSVVQILNHYGINYKDINILEDPNIRIKLSEHSNWPTIPQLFVNGELICLLYTSPSPRDAHESRMPSSA